MNSYTGRGAVTFGQPLATMLPWRPPPGLVHADPDDLVPSSFLEQQYAMQFAPTSDLHAKASKANKESRRGNPLFFGAPGIDLWNKSIPTMMQSSGQMMGNIETPSAPPMPWRLLGDTYGCKEVDIAVDGDDSSTQASSARKDHSPNGSEHGYVYHAADNSDYCDSINEKSSDDFKAENGIEGVRTLMIKHIPCRCTQQEVIDAIGEIGFADVYNFFYLPIRRGHEQNFGYAFIGFVDMEVTKQFSIAMTGYRFSNRKSNKLCEVVPARIQGFSSNVEHFQRLRRTRRTTKSQPTMYV